MVQNKEIQPLSLVCIAAPQDLSLLASWENHLRPLQQAGQIFFWSERALIPGENRLQHMLRYLDHADVIVVLVSAYLFASEECLSLITHILQRLRTKPINVIPLLVRQVAWRESPLGALTSFPANGIPVNMWGNEDEAWHTCVKELQHLLRLPLVQGSSPALRKQDHSDRGKFLRLLRHDYQKDLDASLEHLAWLEMGFHVQPDAVRNATRLSQRRLDQTERSLPEDTSILEVYDEAAESLLILGEPGAGKSMLLTTLGLHLATRADTDPGHPMPVILPLSSWAEDKRDLGDWMVEQMARRYNVPRSLGKRWIQQQQIIPLLDGLDEMKEAARVQCITALNTYRQATFSSLVVCSRTSEYQTASVHHRLVLQQAVIIQPLTEAQIMHTVHQGGTALAALDEALAKSEELRELATTPLMLSILILTYHGTTIPELPEQKKTLEQQIWQQYMKRMIEEKGIERHSEGELLRKWYSPEQTGVWLGWLAQQMRQHSQPVFAGELLQESWIPSHRSRHVSWLVESLPVLLLGATTSVFFLFILFGPADPVSLFHFELVGGFLGWCLYSEKRETEASQRLGRRTDIKVDRLLRAEILALLYAIQFGLYLGPDYSVSNWIHDGFLSAGQLLVSGWLLQVVFPRRGRDLFSASVGLRPSSHWWQRSALRRALWTFVILGFTFGLWRGLNNGLDHGLVTGLGRGLIYGLTVFLLSTILDGNGNTIRLAEYISWTWRVLLDIRHLWSSVLVAVLLFCYFGLSWGLDFGLNKGLNDGLTWGLSSAMSHGLSFGLSYWLLLGLYQGMAQKHLENQDRRRFNQGLHRSLRNSILLSALGVGLLSGMHLLSQALNDVLILISAIMPDLRFDVLRSIALSGALNDELSAGLNDWWLPLLCSWFVLWALIGGLNILRHYTLRVLLACNHLFPLNARRFLDDGVARVLLKHQGGGYAFVHRRLLDYCADTAVQPPEAEQNI